MKQKQAVLTHHFSRETSQTTVFRKQFTCKAGYVLRQRDIWAKGRGQVLRRMSFQMEEFMEVLRTVRDPFLESLLGGGDK